jgi:BirA family transcriptional regulator, biotin operon repressor / biotin---[acetyl-CoA-carboxylase] ligase
MSNTLFVGKVFHQFDELPSTNDWAVELLAKSKPAEGTVVRTATQTAGRGQFGSRWISPAGQNLLMSVIFYPNWLAAKDQFYLSMAVALALHDAVEHPEASIKWPNDLYLGDKKTAGILIQNSISGAHLQSSVIGIGLNVNQREFDPSLPNPTSLAEGFGTGFDLDQVMHCVWVSLEQQYLRLKAGRLEAIKMDYEGLLYRRNQRSRFARTADDSQFEGIIRGVSAAGKLLLEVEAVLEPFDLKELRMLA